MAKKDYYEILEISEEEKNLPEDQFIKKLKSNYRIIAKRFHPDLNPDDPSAEERFKEIADAYSVLSDQDKKNQYDRYGSSQGPQGVNPNAWDHFTSFFRQHQQPQQRKGSNLEITIRITLEEVFSGVTKTFSYKRTIKCTPCNGRGGMNPTNCTNCNGSGNVKTNVRMGGMEVPIITPCMSCNGFGSTFSEPCNSCHGNGVQNADETVEIEIPHGITEGISTVLREKGHAIKNGLTGDLRVYFNIIPHSLYTRDGDNLKANLKVKYSKLILGGKIDVDTIDGKKIRITIPEMSPVGSILRIPNKGLKGFNTETRGDLSLILNLEMPKELSPDLKKVIEEMDSLENK